MNIQRAVDVLVLDMTKRLGLKPFFIRVDTSFRSRSLIGRTLQRPKRSGRTLDFSDREFVIEINLPIFQKLTEQEQRESVVHEVAHAVVDKYVQAGVNSHGPAWRAAMKMYGFDNAQKRLDLSGRLV